MNTTTDPYGIIADDYVKVPNMRLRDFHPFVVQYIGQILSELNLPWTVSSTNKMLNDGTLVCQEVQVFSNHGIMIYGHISRKRSIEDMRDEVAARARAQADGTARHYGFAFATSNKDSVEIEFLQVEPDGTSETMEGRRLEYTDQEEVERVFRTVDEHWGDLS